MTSASTPTRGMPIALSRRANDNSAGWSQVLSLALDGITARHYLSWIRDPDPPALGRDLRAVAIDAAPVSDRIELRLVWDREPPDAETAASIAGFPIGPEVATVTPQRGPPQGPAKRLAISLMPVHTAPDLTATSKGPTEMSISPAMRRPVSTLASALNGKIITPEHARYDEARRAWNLAIDQRPAAVAFPESEHDVAAAILLARRSGLRVAAQGTGHNAGPLGSLEDTVLVRTDRMRAIQIDPNRWLARIEAGAVWLEVVEAAARHGLAALAGSSPDVGVVGYTLGGGMSFLGRKHGLAANAVRAIELVTADGECVRASQENEPDLFWALRGGGGSFAVVTAIELELLPIKQAYAGILWYPIERGHEVFDAWRELTQSEQLPDELTTVGRFLQLPPIPEIPEEVRGKSFVVVEAYHVGDPADADELLSPLRALGPVNDTIARVPMPALSHIHMDPEFPVPGFGDGLMIERLPAEAADALIDVAGANAAFPLLSVELRHLGGALGRAEPQNGALSSIEAQYVMYAVGMVPAPELEYPVQAQVQRVKDAVAPWAARHMYLNFAETPRDPATLWTEQTYHRLRRIKTAVDPHNVIRSNHPIPSTR